MKIAYGLSGVGRGHTMRASSLGTLLKNAGHDIHFFSSGDATEPLKERFGPSRIHFLPTPEFTLVNGKLNVLKTAKGFLQFMINERKRILKLSKKLQDEGYDVVISDFEPLLCRAGLNANVPVLAFNSQNFVNICKIPLKYRHLSAQLAIVNSVIVASPDYTVVSKPVRIKNKPKKGCVVGPMIRQHILGKIWEGKSNHILMYRSLASDWPMEMMIAWAKARGLRILFYGKLNPEEEKLIGPDFIHRPISETQFVDDMINSQFVIGTSGTQLIGELAYLGVPAILIPEQGQIEQKLNALLADDSYPNMATISAPNLTPQKLEETLNQLDGFAIRHTEDGSQGAFQEVQKWLDNLKLK